MYKAVIFDFGHTLHHQGKYNLPLKDRPVILMPGVRSVLPKIKLPMGIWSNTSVSKSKDIKNYIKKCKIDKYFKWIIASASINYRKPQQEFYEYALKKCKLKASEIIFVGNQLDTDIFGAKKMGMTSVWLSGKHHRVENDTMTLKDVKPDYKIKHLKDLPGLISKLQK